MENGSGIGLLIGLLIGLVIILIAMNMIYKGTVKIFQRHNSIIVIFYIFFLFPIALCHILFLGLFGDSKKEIMLKEVKKKVEFDKLVEEEKNK